MKPLALLPILALIFFTILLDACDNDGDENYYTLCMKDGNVVKIDKTYSLNLEKEFPKSKMESIPYNVGEPDSVSGYTSCDSASYWNETKVGDWMSEYGFSPNKKYISRTEYYFKEIPMRSDELCAYYLPKQAKMGLSAENCRIDYKTYIRPNFEYPLNIRLGQNAYPGNKNGAYLAYTAIIHFKYDSEGNLVNVYYPCKPQELTWYFNRFTLEELLNLK